MSFIKPFILLETCILKHINNSYSKTTYLKMSQKTIASYFQKSSPMVNNGKRSSIDAENLDNSNILLNKKLKTDSNELPNELLSDSPTKQGNELETKETQAKVLDKTTPTKDSNRSKLIENENKLKAELKLLSKTLPALHPNIGLTWFDALRDEFGKPYFKKVR